MKLSLFISAFIFWNSLSGQNVIINDSSVRTSFEQVFQGFIGKELNQFSGVSINGTKYSNADFLGKMTLVNFWFSSCPPCVAEFKALNKVFEKFSSFEKFQFISFTFDSEESIKKSIDLYKIKYPIINVSHEKSQELNFGQGFPVNILIDNKGKIIYFIAGGSISEKDADLFVHKVLEPKILNMLK